MIRHWTGIALLTVSLAVPAVSSELPPGKWWRRPELIQVLGLTEDQQTRLDAIFRSNAGELIDLRGDVEKQNIALRGELDQPQLNRTNIQRAAAHLNEARGKLFAQELMLMVDMRSVLSDEQWSKVRNRINSEPRRPNRRGAGR